MDHVTSRNFDIMSGEAPFDPGNIGIQCEYVAKFKGYPVGCYEIKSKKMLVIALGVESVDDAYIDKKSCINVNSGNPYKGPLVDKALPKITPKKKAN